SHRLEPEVSGVLRSGVEAAAVVADLDHHAIKEGLDGYPCRGRSRLLHHAGERLPANAEELGLAPARERDPLPGSLDVDPQPVPVVQARGIFDERRDQAVLDGVATQLEDERAHLALSTSRQVSDRVELPVEGAGPG